MAFGDQHFLALEPVEQRPLVLHPIPDPVKPEDHEHGYKARVAREILPGLRTALGGGNP